MRAIATVTMTLRVHLYQPWDENCTVKQIQAACIREAKENLERELSDHAAFDGFEVKGIQVLLVEGG